MARTRLRERDPHRYSREMRRSGSGTQKRVRFPWRRRTKTARIEKDPSERAEINARRRAKKEACAATIASAESVIFEEAKKLSATLNGQKTPLQAHRMLLQTARVAQSERNISQWNAYIRQEVRKMNDGRCNSNMIFFTVNFDATLHSPSSWEYTSQSNCLYERNCCKVEKHVRRREECDHSRCSRGIKRVPGE
jgi:hypothetical protein